MSQTKTELLQGNLYINGEWVSEEEQTYFESINPATQELVGTCAAATASQVDDAVRAASTAYSDWKNTSIP
ncbi:MAG: aldehyde dehydrogenase family protein, partial [Priestia megaterium]